MNSKVEDASSNLNFAQDGSQKVAAYWSGVFAMSLCVFALIASEFLPVSLLTLMAQDLNVSEGMAGQGIAVSGVFAVLTSLFITLLAGNIDRKTLLLGLTALMALSGLTVALAPNYMTYMLGRGLIGVVIGGFWSISAATAMRLVPTTEVPRALAIFNGGNALATVIAAPLGAYLGAAIGWRGAFFCLVPLAVIAFIWQWRSLPSMPAVASQVNRRAVFSAFNLLKTPIAAVGMLAVGIFFMGQFTLFTYVLPFLEKTTQADNTDVSFTLLMIGVAGLTGTLLIGRAMQFGVYKVLTLVPFIMAALALLLLTYGGNLTATVILLTCWGLLATSAPVVWWAWLTDKFRNDAEAAGGLMVAIIQFSIALGSTAGGLLFDYSGYQITFIASAALLFIATLVAARVAHLDR